MRIALSGKMGSGKSTAANLLVREMDFKTLSVGSAIKPTANLLIQDQDSFRTHLYHVLPNTIETKRAVERVIASFNEAYANAEWISDGNEGYIKNEPYRDLLQKYPMMIREVLGEDVFLRLILNEHEPSDESLLNDDIRLVGEKQHLESLGFRIIRLDINEDVQRERLMKAYGKIDEQALRHPTETALDHETFDLRLDVSEMSEEEVAKHIKEFLFGK